MAVAPIELDFKPATVRDVDTLLPLMHEYYEFDRIPFDEKKARTALTGLLQNETLYSSDSLLICIQAN